MRYICFFVFAVFRCLLELKTFLPELKRRNLTYKSRFLQLSRFNWWVSFAQEFQCCYFCEPSYLFYLSFNFDFYVSKIMQL